MERKFSLQNVIDKIEFTNGQIDGFDRGLTNSSCQVGKLNPHGSPLGPAERWNSNVCMLDKGIFQKA